MFGCLRIDFFQTWYATRHDITLQLDSSVHDLDFHSRSQAHETARTYATVLLKSGMKWSSG